MFGITRQAYYQHYWYMEDVEFEHSLLLKEIDKIRADQKRMGGRKLYEKLEPFMQYHQIKMGRDKFFDLLSMYGLLIRKRKRRVRTTNSFHWFKKYDNLIEQFEADRQNQLWVSDITYWKVAGKFVYISLITDAYSRKIVGYQLWETLEAEGCIRALKKAISGLLRRPDDCFELIHHSDRGIQYCCKEYTQLLKQNRIQISMTQNGDPRENAIAERVNGILKEEYLMHYQPKDIQQAIQCLDRAVYLYNNQRPHLSIGYHTPEYIHQTGMKTHKAWKSYYPAKNTGVKSEQD